MRKEQKERMEQLVVRLEGGVRDGIFDEESVDQILDGWESSLDEVEGFVE